MKNRIPQGWMIPQLPHIKILITEISLEKSSIQQYIYMFSLPICLPAFLDTDLPRANVHERDSGPMQGAIPTQSYNP